MAAYSTIYDSRRFVRSDSTDTTVLLPVAAGGSGANLSGTGGANQFVKQSTAGGAFTVGALGSGDVPDGALSSNAALLNRNAQNFTGTYNQFVQVGIGGAPNAAWNLHIQGNGGILSQTETLDSTTSSQAQNRAVSGASLLWMASHAAARTITRYGVTLGGWAEFTAASNTGSNLGLVIGTQAAVPLVLGTNNAERMRIDSSGNVIVGATASSGSGIFHVGGSSYPSLVYLSIDAAAAQQTGIEFLSAGTQKWVIYRPGNSSDLRFYDGSADRLILSGGNVGINVVPDASSALRVDSTTGAILIPRMTTTQKNALTAIDGMIVYDTTLGKFQGREAGAWNNFSLL